MYLLHLVVFLAATSIYSNSLTGDFVHDDIVAIVRNPDVNLARSAKIGLSSFFNNGENWDRWWSLWKNDYWGMPMSSQLSHKSYRPLTVLTFRLNFYLCDNSLCPEIFHGTNMFIHGLVSSLILYLCQSVLKMRTRAAVLTSLLFSLHPIHTEAVAGITGRADALACLLMLISFLLYHKVLSLSSPKIFYPLKNTIDCQDQPEMRESEKCDCKSNSVKKNFVTDTTTNQSNANTVFIRKVLDLNDNEHLKSTIVTFTLFKANALLVASGFVGFAAMLAKETGITVLGINLLYDLYLHLPSSASTQSNVKNEENEVNNNSHRCELQHKRPKPRNFTNQYHRNDRRKRLFFLISMIFLSLSIRVAIMNGEFPRFGRPDNPAAFTHSKLTRLLTFAYLPIYNFLLTIYPRTLSYDWQMGSIPLMETIWDSRNFATCAFHVTLVLLVRKGMNSKKYKKGNPVLAVALLFIVIPYLPASNLLFPVGFVVAERVLYIPSLGICIIIAHGIELLYQAINTKLERKYPLKVLFKFCIGVSVCALFLSFGLRTWQRNAVWQSRLTLFTSGIHDVPHNAKTHYNYANLQKDMGQYKIAIEHYTIATKLWPEYASAHNNLGTLLMDSPAEAEHHFLRAIQAGNQAHGGAHFNLGVLYMHHKKYLQAATHLKKSIIVDPSHKEAMEYLSACYSKIHTQMEDKSRDNIKRLEKSTSDRLNTTAERSLDTELTLNSINTELNDEFNIISQNTEVTFPQKQSSSFKSLKSSKQCDQNKTCIIHTKQLGQQNVFHDTAELSSKFYNDLAKIN